MTQIRKSLERDLADVRWADLRIHLRRDAIILVTADLDLLDVGVAVAEDDKKQVEKWLDGHLLSKPDRSRLEIWEKNPAHPLRMLIVQPFILVQDISRA